MTLGVLSPCRPYSRHSVITLQTTPTLIWVLSAVFHGQRPFRYNNVMVLRHLTKGLKGFTLTSLIHGVIGKANLRPKETG